MKCTNNTCLAVLIFVFLLLISPIFLVLYLLIWIGYQIYCITTFSYVCCEKVKWDTSGDHHTKNGFQNPWRSFDDKNPLSAAVMLWDWVKRDDPQQLHSKPLNFKDIRQYHSSIDSDSIDDKKEEKRPIRYTWLGHATALIQMDGINILTDPMFSERASALQWLGPKRHTPCLDGLWEVDNLPMIDLVLISHDHYDHLDYNTICYLAASKKVRYFCAPLRIGQWLHNNCGISFDNIIELDWYNDASIAIENSNGGCSVICTPSQHFSSRTLFDRNHRLWCSWVVKTKNYSVWFGGDTGYTSVSRNDWKAGKDGNEERMQLIGNHTCPAFKEIGSKYGPFDLSCIPIGAYSPRWFMSSVHLSPLDACYVHKDIRSKKSVAIHWGTFQLTDEMDDEPPKFLKECMDRTGISNDDFIVTHPGEVVFV